MPKARLIPQDQIAERAFEIWEHEGKPHGQDQEHWVRAERELRKTMTRMSPSKSTRAAKSPTQALDEAAAAIAKTKASAKAKAPAKTVTSEAKATKAPARTRASKAKTA